MTSITQIERKVCMKNVNNQRLSIGGKMLTIPQIMWKSINNPALITIPPPKRLFGYLCVDKCKPLCQNQRFIVYFVYLVCWFIVGFFYLVQYKTKGPSFDLLLASSIEFNIKPRGPPWSYCCFLLSSSI